MDPIFIAESIRTDPISNANSTRMDRTSNANLNRYNNRYEVLNRCNNRYEVFNAVERLNLQNRNRFSSRSSAIGKTKGTPERRIKTVIRSTMNMENVPSSSRVYTSEPEDKSKSRNKTSENPEAEHAHSFAVDIPVIKKLNINIPQKRTIDMLSQEIENFSDEDSCGNLMTCPVCLEEYSCSDEPVKEPLFLDCHHTICRGCFLKIFQRAQEFHKCPMCRVNFVGKKFMQKNYYVEALLKGKSRKSDGLAVWCKECQAVATKECSSHEFQEISEAVSYLWKTNSDLWTSLTGIIADLDQSSKLSQSASEKALSNMIDSMCDLLGIVRGIEHMFEKLLKQKRSICEQMGTIQTEIQQIKPYMGRFKSLLSSEVSSVGEDSSSFTSAASSTVQPLQLGDHEKQLRNIRHLPHETQVIMAKQIRAVINMLNDIEKYSNIAVNNREALNAAIVKIDAEQIRTVMGEKLQAVLKSIEKTLKDFDPGLDQGVELVSL